MTTKDLIYCEIRRLAETNYSDPTTVEHCIRCGNFLMDMIFSKFIENEYFIRNQKYSRQLAWARKYAHIQAKEFAKFDVIKLDPLSKKRKRFARGKSFVDMFIANGLVFRNNRYSNSAAKSFSKSYTLGGKYLNALIQEHIVSDSESLEVEALVDCYYDELAPFWYSSFHDFWKYSLNHKLTKAEKRLFDLSKKRIPKEMCSYNMKLADIWNFDIPKPKCVDVIDLDDSEYPF